ncbi:MAG TPA: sensor histidine kinase [Desulfobulbus sp.]|nr:sensor histidine kinase [Desulfobulbus sp.]
MDNLLQRIRHSLSAKLIITIALLLIVGVAVSCVTLIINGRNTLMQYTVDHIASSSELVKKSIHYGMLTFDRESIQRIIDSISSKENIIGIRIFDSRGEIFFSSSPDEIGRLVDRSAFACTGCHSDPENPSATLTADRQWVSYRDSRGNDILTFVDPIFNDISCATAECHVHPSEQRVLGVLESDFSLAPLNQVIRRQIVDTVVFALFFMVFISLLLYFILRRFVLRPLTVLAGAMRRVGRGELIQNISIPSRDEIGVLAETFNEMTRELEIARKKEKSWTEELEKEVEKKTKELKKSRDKLIHAEKLASLGRLTADVAHEVRNPLMSIGGFARRLNKCLTGGKEKQYAEIIIEQVDRLESILRDVLTFSRGVQYRFEKRHLEKLVTTAVEKYKHLSTELGITIRFRSDRSVPPVLIDEEQALEALGNLIVNGMDAMPGGGELDITLGTEQLNHITYVYVRVTDHGQGIPEDELPYIFEPFFSTKEIGHGTGLGLSITRKIIEEHGGFIKAGSRPGKGASFSLYFPHQSDEEAAKTPCWELMRCGRDKDASLKCPAYPHFGRICWVVAGTFCEGKIQGTFAQKSEDCKKCRFYQLVAKKEQNIRST